MHQDEPHQSCGRNCEEFGDQNIMRDCGKAELDGKDRRQPTGQDDCEVLHKLANIITPPASKYPEFVQQEMTGHANKVSD
jgi:hypothetical protein